MDHFNENDESLMGENDSERENSSSESDSFQSDDDIPSPTINPWQQRLLHYRPTLEDEGMPEEFVEFSPPTSSSSSSSTSPYPSVSSSSASSSSTSAQSAPVHKIKRFRRTKHYNSR